MSSRLEEQIGKDLGIEPLVVGMDKYALASELAFYRRHGKEGVEQTSSRHHFGGSGLMYGFWFPPQQYAGRTLLLISLDRTNLERQNIPRWARLGPIEERRSASTEGPCGISTESPTTIDRPRPRNAPGPQNDRQPAGGQKWP